MIKAVIFDMDGLIIDSEPIHSLSLEKVLLEYEKTPIYNETGLIHDVGTTGNKNYEKVMQKHNLQEDLEIIREKRRKIFEDLINRKLTPKPGLLQLLEILKKENLKLAVASNRLINHIHIMLDNLGVKKYFEVIVGPNPQIKPKPAPDIFLQAAKELNITPNECLILEDSETGIIAGKAAGMKVIAVPNQYTKTHDFSKADKVVESLEEIDFKLLQNQS